ncbi:hypothetical protein GCM10007874_32560 [Labrys miyagiensis]|uniref:Uncharacterized protein n=1 Tax=Labrys miyagiensis TaxID=346912 RepID=A0ABQ6CKG3_9HYPH|nr:hypothetical protein GCM10007874_32560 [Labrys miyagiensis]
MHVSVEQMRTLRSDGLSGWRSARAEADSLKGMRSGVLVKRGNVDKPDSAGDFSTLSRAAGGQLSEASVAFCERFLEPDMSSLQPLDC